ncbi:hypothetical protein ASG52_19730 [Methylobacterium sp. Leaf456]|uniref:Thoeris anti-defense Tad2 family protein n=1 Tax=Methylobacterium sp. Leaf456 TaxID=1736382 RepID=UPI0006F99CAB|nr:MW1434 family type I TA system toxin [Methylobacterium sp. Leaf456]KQT59958.1 hypothetical protein ASG52_19730 [Methylobacterium sp. Leaf456]
MMSEPHTLEAGASDPVTIASQLRVIAKLIEYWLDFDTEQRSREGLETTRDTHLIAPPSWPSHGALRAWVGTLSEASAALASSAGPVPDEMRRNVESLVKTIKDTIEVWDKYPGTADDGAEALWQILPHVERLLATPSGRPDTPPAGGGAAEQIATDDLVDRFAAALKSKLRASEAKYGWQNGWLKDDWATDCQRDLLRHVGKGDPLDVAAYAAFCWHHGWKTAAAPEPAAGGGREIVRPAWNDLYEAGRVLIVRWERAPELPEEMEGALATFEETWLALMAAGAGIAGRSSEFLAAPAHGSAGGEGYEFALAAIKRGASCRRKAWKPGKSVRLTRPKSPALSYLALVYDSGVITPWTPTRCDQLEEDWIVLPTPATSSTPAEGK